MNEKKITTPPAIAAAAIPQLEVTLRPYLEATDAPFIYSTFIPGAYYGGINHDPQNFPSRRIYARHREASFQKLQNSLNRLLDSGSCYVASAKDDPTLLFGYSIYKAAQLQWVFIKPYYRFHGLARLLIIKEHFPKSVSYEFMTKVGQSILTKALAEKSKKKEEEHHHDEQSSQPNRSTTSTLSPDSKENARISNPT